jgi:hypothetical protein
MVLAQELKRLLGGRDALSKCGESLLSGCHAAEFLAPVRSKHWLFQPMKRRDATMSKSAYFREKAAECDRMAKLADNPERRAAYEEMQRSWSKIADRADWLARDEADEID